MKSTFDPEVVLISPPATSKRYAKTKFMPYGMVVLHAYLKEHGVAVAQHDFLMEYLYQSPQDIDHHNPERSFGDEDFFAFLNGTAAPHPGLAAFAAKYAGRVPPKASIYAFSVVSYHQFWGALLLAKRLRDLNPEAIIVFGGPFVTIKPLKFLSHFRGPDFYIKGSGEKPLLRLAELRRAGLSLGLSDIPGLVYFNGSKLIQNPPARLAAEEERPPDFEGLPLEAYGYDHPLSGQKTLFLPYRITKGCPSRCSFCTGRLVDEFSPKSADKVVRELKALSGKYGSHNFMFADASINADPALLAQICDRLRVELPGIRWYAYARVNGFSPELLAKVKGAGCFALFWGVESAHQPTIKLLGKRFEAARIHGLIDAAVSLGIKNYIHVMYNTPHETEADLAALRRLMERYLNCDLVAFMPMRFLLESQSLIFDHPQRFGLTNIRRVETSLFEREEYAYDELGGLDSASIQVRNEKHRRVLSGHLEWIRYQRLRSGHEDKLLAKLPPKLIMFLGRQAHTSRLADKARQVLIKALKASGPALREQL